MAQFLNSLAAGMVATLVLAPLASGTLRPELAATAVVGATITHLLALYVGRRPS